MKPTKLVLLACLALAAASAQALEFRSVKETGTLLYDAPGGQGKKLFVVSRSYPVEVLARQGNWARVRDATGGIAWVDYARLSPQRTVIVTAADASVRTAPDTGAPVSFHAARDVVLDLVEPPKSGWAKVRHADGSGGYLPLAALWGL
ncbi:MAG: SH3 domain-containing protein [Laribacter sp.]|nr:SH3 domain-containing protein [Laribacter sp.]MBP9526767.1 SH3 domain-containing protein [Laribacter sp.]MBP9609501.1 SH3 domain-containing protein [Laribacter sp.]